MRSFQLLSAMALCATALVAQVDTARITGTITDQTGARIPGVKVVIRNLETNIEMQTAADSVGVYRSVPLRIGLYSVSASHEGFKTAVREGIHLDIQQEAIVDMICPVGSTTEQVDVHADAPQLQAYSASQGQVIDLKKIVDLPLNGRDYLQLALLTTGANYAASGARFGGFSSSGLRTSHNNYLIDGIDNNSNQAAATGRSGQVVEPSLTMVEEFKVETNAYSAEYGRNLGGVVNVSTRAGTNAFHGQLLEFFRNEAMDAKNFFDSPEEAKPPYKRNQFGGGIGGPIRKDKTFFFFDWEGTRFHSSDTVLSTVPTALEKRGDFSQSILRNAPVRVFDPLSYSAATRARTEFPNAVIPESRIDPVARAAADFYPLPNRAGLVNNFLYNPLTVENTNKWDIRADHRINAADSIYARFSYLGFTHFGGPNLPPPAYGGGDVATTARNGGRSFVLNHTHIFTPSLFNTLKLGYNRLLTQRTSPTDENLNKRIGLNGLPFDMPGLAVMAITGYRTLGTQASTPNTSDSQTRQIVDDMNWMRGRHTLKLGANISFIQAPSRQVYQANGNLSFNGNFSRQSSNNQFGSPFADFLLGLPFQSQISNAANGNLRRRLYHFYVQEDLRATDRLTVNVGVRWEYTGPLFEKYNHFANYDVDTDPAHPKIVLARSGSIQDRSLVQPHYRNFAPRAGIAYRLGNRTVLRSGYGMYYGGVDTYGDRYLHAAAPFFFQSSFFTDSITPTILLRDGYPANAVTANVSNLQTISQDRTNLTPYSQNWNFAIQRQLSTNVAVDIGYYASKASHLLIRRDLNAPPPGPGNINDRRPYKSVEVPGLSYLVTPLTDMFRREWVGNSNYHSLQAKIEKRFSGGLGLLAAYTFSKAISDGRGGADAGNTSGEPQNPYNLTLERALADEHRPHRFVFSYNYDFPFGRGKKHFSSMLKVVDLFLGGWGVGGITTLSSGRTVTAGVQGDPANTGTTNRPNQVAPAALPRSERSIDRWFNTAAFVANAPYTYGNAARNTIQGPGTINLDLGTYKQFGITEKAQAQFRVECFNLTNTPHFGAPNATVGTNQIGIISNADDGRIFQLGLRVRF
jgi:Carboxypeptidase regulatory-like domain/TonB dependent receptor